MPHVIVNGATLELAGPQACWSDLLEALDRRASEEGMLISSVRFDGVDEPGFREAAVLVRRLESDGIVEVDTESPAALLDRMLDEAAASLPVLEAATRELAGAFRGSDATGPSRGLAQLAESLMNLVFLLAAAGEARGISLDALSAHGEPLGPRIVALDRALAPLVEAQAAHDWITVADELEYQVAPLLAPLVSVVDALRPTQNHA